MEPNIEQRDALARNAGSRRWVWNWALGRKQQYYRDNGVGLWTSVLKAELPILKRQAETAWLAEADSQSLQETLRDLDRAFQNFFEGRARFPRGMGVDLAAPVLPLGVGNATKSLRARRGATEGAGEQVGPSYSLAKI